MSDDEITGPGPGSQRKFGLGDVTKALFPVFKELGFKKKRNTFIKETSRAYVALGFWNRGILLEGEDPPYTIVEGAFRILAQYNIAYLSIIHRMGIDHWMKSASPGYGFGAAYGLTEDYKKDKIYPVRDEAELAQMLPHYHEQLSQSRPYFLQMLEDERFYASEVFRNSFSIDGQRISGTSMSCICAALYLAFEHKMTERYSYLSWVSNGAADYVINNNLVTDERLRLTIMAIENCLGPIKFD